MSRIGRKPITIPAGVSVQIEAGKVNITGPKGTLSQHIPGEIMVHQEGDQLLVTRPDDSKQNRALHGLTRALLANMVQGVSNGFERMNWSGWHRPSCRASWLSYRLLPSG